MFPPADMGRYSQVEISPRSYGLAAHAGVAYQVQPFAFMQANRISSRRMARSNPEAIALR